MVEKGKNAYYSEIRRKCAMARWTGAATKETKTIRISASLWERLKDISHEREDTITSVAEGLLELALNEI
jgi:hypothetical protein